MCYANTEVLIRGGDSASAVLAQTGQKTAQCVLSVRIHGVYSALWSILSHRRVTVVLGGDDGYRRLDLVCSSRKDPLLIGIY